MSDSDDVCVLCICLLECVTVSQFYILSEVECALFFGESEGSNVTQLLISWRPALLFHLEVI